MLTVHAHEGERGEMYSSIKNSKVKKRKKNNGEQLVKTPDIGLASSQRHTRFWFWF